jgi:hypothetical protein
MPFLTAFPDAAARLAPMFGRVVRDPTDQSPVFRRPMPAPDPDRSGRNPRDSPKSRSDVDNRRGCRIEPGATRDSRRARRERAPRHRSCRPPGRAPEAAFRSSNRAEPASSNTARRCRDRPALPKWRPPWRRHEPRHTGNRNCGHPRSVRGASSSPPRRSPRSGRTRAARWLMPSV